MVIVGLALRQSGNAAVMSNWCWRIRTQSGSPVAALIAVPAANAVGTTSGGGVLVRPVAAAGNANALATRAATTRVETLRVTDASWIEVLEKRTYVHTQRGSSGWVAPMRYVSHCDPQAAPAVMRPAASAVVWRTDDRTSTSPTWSGEIDTADLPERTTAACSEH